MSKIVSDQILDRIRQATDIVSIIRDVVPLRKSGSGLVGLCPFHKEKTPSFHVNPDRQIFKCFGCHVGGDIFSFVMKTDGVTFPEAIRLLAERAHIELPDDEFHGGEPGEKTRLYEANTLAAELYHRALIGAPGKKALEYLLQRGLTMETIKLFKIGYSPDARNMLTNYAMKKGFEPALLQKAGLVGSSDNGGLYDRFRNRVMFPIKDTQEHFIGFGARSLDGSEPKYLNSPETPLFVKGRTLYGIEKAKVSFREKRQAIVVEGYMDVVMAHQYGVTWTVAVLGTALSSDHVRVLRRHVDEAILLFDSDNAGQSSASRSVDAFAAEELSARVVTLPEGLDPDEYLMKHGAQSFLEQMSRGVDGITFRLNRALAGAATDADGSSLPAAKALDDVLATVALIPNSVAQMRELRKVAERAGVPEWTLQQRLAAVAAGASRWSAAEPAAEPATSAVRDLERELLLVMLTYPQTIALVQERLKPDQVHDAVVRTLIQRACKMASEAPDFGVNDLLARTQEEPLREAIERVIGQDHVRVEEPTAWCMELLRGIAARAHDRVAREMHRKVSVSPDPSADDLNERLRAVREAQRTRGLLQQKRSS